MAIKSTLIVSCLLLCVLAVFARTSSNNNWDYMLFVQRWPETFCEGHHCHSTLNQFTIHGLWPNRADGSYPQNCRLAPQFSKQNLTDHPDVLSAMLQWWPDVQQGDNYGFWSHEWNKHGTCAASVSALDTEQDFFKYSCNLAAKTDIFNNLANAGITPGNGPYTAKAIKAAVKSAVGAIPSLQCYNGDLWRVNLCVGKDLQLYDCTQWNVADEGCSQNQITYPAAGTR